MRVLGFMLICGLLVGCADRRSLETYHESKRTDQELISRYHETNSPTEEYVNRVAKRVMSVSDRSTQNYSFEVENDPHPILNIDPETNTVILSQGVLHQLKDEAELAATLTLCMQRIDARHNRMDDTVQTLAAAGYDPHALLDLQEQYLAAGQNGETWLAEVFYTPPTASSIKANKLLIDKLPAGGQRGAEHYRKFING